MISPLFWRIEILVLAKFNSVFLWLKPLTGTK